MILIVSKGRPALRAATADMLLAAGIVPTFVVPADECFDYMMWNRPCKVIGHPTNLVGLPSAMEWAFNTVPRNQDVVIFMDDDLHFFNRFDGTSRLPKNEPFETEIMVRWLYKKAKDYGHATISPTQFNNVHSYDEKVGCAARSVLAYDVNMLHREKIEIARVPSKNDYDITLQLFKRGIPNICAFNMCHKQVGGPELPGGCTSYRNEGLHAAASDRLAQLHPDYVKVVIKTKPQWPFPRADVIIRWKKAYEDGLQQSHNRR